MRQYVSYSKLFLIMFSLFIAAFPLFAQSNNVLSVGKVDPGDLDMAAFTLTEDVSIKISGSGASFGDWEDNMEFYGWIIKSSSRELVWHMRSSDDYDEDDGIYDCEDEIFLSQGDYEVYYSGSLNYFGDTNISGIIERIFGDNDYKESYKMKLYMTLEFPSSGVIRRDAKEIVDDLRNNAIVSLCRVGDYEDLEKSFSLSDDTQIRIYAIGEGHKSTTYDIAWIYDANSNRRVWTLDARYADHAGGGQKNIKADVVITLPKGSYKVRYSSDDSHSFDGWNVLPPDDPQFWGVTLWAASDNDLANVIPFQEGNVISPIIELVRVGNDEFVSQGFTLDRDMDVRILCMGEGSGSKMADHGWIIDADSKKTVWKMYIKHSEHAGGADKNRVVDEEIHLSRGNYIAYYSTDDSHAYNKWNMNPPFEKERWGLTIWPVDKVNWGHVKLFDEGEFNNENILAEIVRVKDSRSLSKSFSLSRDTKVRIIAIGEGDKRELYDYGWIENDKGRIIWELTPRNTEHAGGAPKNRFFNGVILLQAGKYKVFYKSDDSHSYNMWNSSPPDHPELYGITIFLEK